MHCDGRVQAKNRAAWNFDLLWWRTRALHNNRVVHSILFFIGTRQSKRALQASVISIRAGADRPMPARDLLTIDSRDSRRRVPGKTEFLGGGGACARAPSVAGCANEIVKQSQPGRLAGWLQPGQVNTGMHLGRKKKIMGPIARRRID